MRVKFVLWQWLCVQLQLCQSPIADVWTCAQLFPPIWSLWFISRDLYLHCRSLANRAKRSFYFGPPTICALLHNLEKTEQHKCFILSSSLLWFNGIFAPIGETAHKRIHVLSVMSYKRMRNTKQDTCPVPCSLVVYLFLVILLIFVILTISNYF